MGRRCEAAYTIKAHLKRRAFSPNNSGNCSFLGVCAGNRSSVRAELQFPCLFGEGGVLKMSFECMVLSAAWYI